MAVAREMIHTTLPGPGEKTELAWESIGKASVEIPGCPLPYRPSVCTYRAQVPGGWLVLVLAGGNDTAVTFYPDPFHQWNGGS